MANILKIAGALCAAACAAVLLFFCFAASPDLAQHAGEPETGAAKSPAGPAHLSVLFPGLDISTVTAVSISTPDRSFTYAGSSADHVTVNGQQADRDIYQTLLAQIAELPVSPLSALPPKPRWLLTITVTAGAQQRTAHFYDDGGAGTEAFILCGTQETPQYRQTDVWRIGTLMMACEGTRIEGIPDANSLGAVRADAAGVLP